MEERIDRLGFAGVWFRFDFRGVWFLVRRESWGWNQHSFLREKRTNAIGKLTWSFY